MYTEPVYRQQVTLSDLHLDCFRRLKPSTLLYLVQDVSGKHAALLGSDWETLDKKGLFWAILRHRVEISRLPCAEETITLETWPMPTTRVAYPRATVAYDQAGQELFRTVALWVLMDRESRAMVLPAKSGVIVPGTLRGLEPAMPASLLPRPMENSLWRQVGYSELDRNAHMNNTRYLDWVEDLLPSAFHSEHPLREMSLCYLAEAREGQAIQLSWSAQSLDLTVEATRPDGEKNTRIFAAKLGF